MDYFTATTGNDNQPGTEEAPFRTIQHGVKQLRSGDTLRIMPGEYHEVIDALLAGNENGWITIEAYDPNNKPIIDGRAPYDLDDMRRRGLNDINYGLPQARYSKRNMNQWSKTFGATATSRALVNIQSGSRYFKVRNLKLHRSLGRHFNFEAAQPQYVNGRIEDTPESAFTSRGLILDGIEFDWARLQSISIKNVADIEFINCTVSHAASFWQTAPPRPRLGPLNDLQTHNAAVSMGGCKNVDIDMDLWECWGEGLIFSSNSVRSTGILVTRFTGWDCGKSPLYVHSATYSTIKNALVYRSAENLKYGHNNGYQVNGKDNPAFNVNGISIQSSEGDKDWNNAARFISVDKCFVSHCDFGISISGSPNTAPISDVTITNNIVINPVGNCLSMKGNEPKRVKVTGNTFYQKNDNSPLAGGTPERYDNTTTIDGNTWSRKPDAFYSGPNDTIGDPMPGVPLAPLAWGTLSEGGAVEPPPVEPPPVNIEVKMNPIDNPSSAKSFIVSWQPVADVVEYRLQYQRDGSPWQLEYTGPETEYIFTGLEPGEYCFRVRSTKDGQAYANSNVECTTVTDAPVEPPPPPPPTTATAQLSVGIVSWTITATENSVTAVRSVA